MFHTNKIKLNLGSGIKLKAGFINVDAFFTYQDLVNGAKTKKGKFMHAVVPRNAKFVQAMIQKLPFPDNYADYVEMSHVIEHLQFRQVIPTLKEIYRVMKPGAELVIATNDTDGVVLEWVKMMTSKNFNLQEYENLMQILHGDQGDTGAFHLTPFNADYMNYCLVSAGFKVGEIGLIQKYQKFPKMRELNYGQGKHVVARNAQLYAIVKK